MKHMDYIYLKEDYYKNKKETFSFLIDILQKQKMANSSILDLGCSKGELLYHIKKELPKITKLTGLDYSSDLISAAKEQTALKGIDLKVGDAQNFTLNESFDFIVCAGTTGYFDSLDKLFDMVKIHLNKNGVALIFHLFNELDVDVQVKDRNNAYFSDFETGWNLHSINTAKKLLNSVGLKLKDTHKFELSFDDKPKEDPARSWTVYVDGEKKLTNGLGQVYDLICLELTH